MAGRALARRLAACLPRHHDQQRNMPAVLSRSFATPTPTDSTKQQGDVVNAEKKGNQLDQRRGQAPSLFGRRRPGGGLITDLLSPFGQPTSLMHMMDTLDRIFENALFSPPPLATSSTRIPFDVMEDEKCFKLRVDMPGVSKEELQISVENGDLVIKAEHKAEDKDDDWSARSYGSYNLRIKLPDNVDCGNLKAELKNGVLKITAPKVEGKTQKIDVQVE